MSIEPDLDIVPQLTRLVGDSYYSREPLRWFHRNVWVPGNTHHRGPACFCEPILMTPAEVETQMGLYFYLGYPCQ